MFESFITGLLTKHLGWLVEDLNEDSLKIGVFGGDVVLNNLRVKPSALEFLDLPVQVKAGFVGELRLKIPWNSLGGGSDPVVISLDQVFVLAVPATELKYDEEAERKKEQAAKKAKLAALEEKHKKELAAKVASSSSSSKSSAPSSEGFVSRWVPTEKSRRFSDSLCSRH